MEKTCKFTADELIAKLKELAIVKIIWSDRHKHYMKPLRQQSTSRGGRHVVALLLNITTSSS
jgi:hypothetical protein